jgi:hypothetical protein
MVVTVPDEIDVLSGVYDNEDQASSEDLPDRLTDLSESEGPIFDLDDPLPA